MMTCPRIIRYELLVVDFAQKLLKYYGEQVLFKRSSLEKDMQDLKNCVSYEESTILKHNVSMKRIFNEHLKLLVVLTALLQRFQSAEATDPQISNQTWTSLTFERVSPEEDDDDDFTVFKRRMGMRKYFKELMIQTKQIVITKANRAKQPQVDKPKKPTSAVKKKKKPAK